ncbi:UNVERIFIED_CONTAM: protein BIG GRAIN 1-like B [Sesamum latifolium]|uniref:Protein BIG GRAIN 1-like B n=1 Tax=Sesamum latifolium TaxID=2727402 RepID=A0AAW2SP20_9LAMI
MPSFSSTLLDEIYRSIDGNAEDFKAYKEKPVKRQGGLRAKNTTTTAASIEDGEVTSFRRACLVEKWMEKEAHEKVVAKTRPPLLPELDNKSLHDNDLLFFSSTSSSSDSSGALSSSDTEFFGSTRNKPKVSCFSSRPKPVRTGVSARESNPREECGDSLFDDYENRQRNKAEDELIKSKSRALKIYANLKKVRQPISPGGRLTSFINSLFSNANAKKSKNLDTNKGFQVQDLKSPKATSSTTCSSASSFSRSCLSKYSPKSREKMRNGVQRSVRFHPVSVIVDEDSRPCGHKCIYGEDSDRHARSSSLPPNALEELKLSIREKNRKVEEAAQNALKGYLNKRGDDFSMFRKIHNDEDDDDGMSDSSSDLFELDHLALFGNNRYCEELPVYETTHLDKNLAIASRLIR